MHMRRVACLRQGRLADRAEALPGRGPWSAHGDIRLLGEVGIVRREAAAVAQHDGRAVALVLIDRVDSPVCRGATGSPSAAARSRPSCVRQSRVVAL